MTIQFLEMTSETIRSLPLTLDKFTRNPWRASSRWNFELPRQPATYAIQPALIWLVPPPSTRRLSLLPVSFPPPPSDVSTVAESGQPHRPTRRRHCSGRAPCGPPERTQRHGCRSDGLRARTAPRRSPPGSGAARS